MNTESGKLRTTKQSAAVDERVRQRGELSSGALGAADIIFMVIAAAAPMAVVVALMPMAFAFGNGGGVTGAWLIAMGAMLLFAIGYVRIIPHVRNAGAFYAYIAASLGRTCGLGAAYVAALSYFALSCSTLAAFAFFTEQLFEELTGRQLPWSIWAFSSIVAICWLAYRRITLAAKVLAIALVAEIAIILLLDFKIVYDVGLGSFDLTVFSPDRVFVPGLGIAAIYAFNSMIGMEGTAIYQEEARDRNVTVPRATYLALVLTGVFYLFTAWCLTSSMGADTIGDAARVNPGTFIAERSVFHLGRFGGIAVGVLVLTSAFAAALALFNNAARYLYALARDGVLPQALARTHAKHQSPYVAGFVLTIALALVFVIAVAMDLDPLLNVSTALIGVGSVGLMALLAITALGIPIFFVRKKHLGWAYTVAPLVGGLIILSATIIASTNYSALTGVEVGFINQLPYGLVVMFGVGALQGLWLRARRPADYARIGATHVG